MVAVTASDLVRLAEAAAQNGARLQACELSRRALTMAAPDGDAAMRARRVLSGLIPGYHLAMANDPPRIDAWTRALARAVTPGMRVLEIGTGAGLLALLAARAGARVVTCERDPVLAALAREVIAANGLAAQVQVVEAEATALRIPEDLDAPADLLIGDIFSDTVFGFDPAPAIAHARSSLLVSGATVMPRAVSAWVALASWDHRRVVAAPAFDFHPLSAFVPASIPVPHGAVAPTLLSNGVELFRYVTTEDPGREATSVVELVASESGPCNGLEVWVRLELDDVTVLESKPDRPHVAAFPSPRFIPLTRAMTMQPGERVTVVARRDRDQVTISLGSRG
jgi:SAM-dependent methyltransferase